MIKRIFSAVVHKEGKLYVSECPEVGTVSQGETKKAALKSLTEATSLYLEVFAPEAKSSIVQFQ